MIRVRTSLLHSLPLRKSRHLVGTLAVVPAPLPRFKVALLTMVAPGGTIQMSAGRFSNGAGCRDQDCPDHRPGRQGAERGGGESEKGRVFVANYASNTVSVLDRFTNAIIATVAVGKTPDGIAVNPPTNRVYSVKTMSR